MRRFVAVFKRDKHSPPPLVTDHAHSSASSSSGSASLCLQTPDDDQHLPAAVERQASRKSWRSWLKGSSKKTHLPDWSHDVEDIPSEPSFPEEPPDDPLQHFTLLVKNSLQPPPPPPTPFSRRPHDPYAFPKSVDRPSLLPRSHSLATLTLKRHILKRLQDGHRPFSESELRSIAPLASRRITPVPVNQLPHPFNATAPYKTTIISPSSPGLGTWVSRPCFEDRYDLFIPEQDDTISRRPVVGSDLAVAALEFSQAIEAMVDSDLSPQLVVDTPSETVSPPPSSSGHSRNSPHIPAPSPLRNEHNMPPSPSVSVTQSAPPTVPISTETDSSAKRGVRFAEDGKDDVIPLGYVLRMKKKREEKAKFLKAEQERRVLEEERMRYEEERQKRDAERAEWERERRAWEKEKRTMEEERQQRKYAEEVAAARLRRETQRAGGVPSLKASGSDAFLGPNTSAGYFPASASSLTSERNKPPTARSYFRSYDDGGAPAYLPRREASESDLPARLSTNPPASFHITPSPRGSFRSNSPSSSPPSIERPPSPDGSSPLTRSPSVHSSQEVLSSPEDVKAAVAAAANRAKRHSFAASISSRNNSNLSLSSDRASYPMWAGSNHSLNNVIPPVPMIPPMQMMPMPAYAMMDMPLLPPTPPFMMQHYPRHHGSPGSPGSGSGSPKGRLGGSSNSSREKLASQNPSREGAHVIGGAGRSGSVERGYVGERSSSEGRSYPSRSASFPRPEAPRHTSSSPVQGSKSGSPHRVHHGHAPYSSPTGPSSRRTSMPVSHQHFHSPQQCISHDLRPQVSTHTHSQPVLTTSAQNLQQPSPWTGLPTQSGKLPNGNSNASGNGSRGNKTVPPRHVSYSGVRSEGVRQSNMRTDPPRQARRQTVIS
ncbi:hypothetical protein C0995_011580 [Termitomyces sp. Mi166|nr:hypothetical protein C0995_011580 [Termitomyces sp. Mi166\